ncbi:MAG: type IV toxin-antitoxin system AbiEi family antitoxin [Pirellulaceae bacterium]|nr:type IV toxin-antitoxin system AbiEi family antitoxin [Pirellulaceae bacterium]
MTPHPPQLDRLLAEILAELGAFQVSMLSGESDPYRHVRVLGPSGADFRLEVKEYKRITPATAESACLALNRQGKATGAQPVLFASIVSDRTSEIATEYGVSWMDYVGNCRLVFPAFGIYVRRSGLANPHGKQLPKVLNVFSAKSSRVIRAMLQEPLRGWQLNELAAHPDVRISPGLMSRIKCSLIEGGYTVMQAGKIRLKRPDDLLDDWVNHYRNHKPKEYNFYLRGELPHVEQQIAEWCSRSLDRYALSRFSAAWRLAPEVRYHVASFMVPARATVAEPWIDLASHYGARKVDSGANLVLQVVDDESYFGNRLGDTIPTTSPLQTYLDLKAMEGRGEEAAMAIYGTYFKQSFANATEQTAEHHEGN